MLQIQLNLGAIIIALDVIIEIGCRGTGSFIVEMGSLVVYNWLLDKVRRPWSHQATFADLERSLACVDMVTFSFAEPNGNEMADTLAVVRIKRPGMFKAWW